MATPTPIMWKGSQDFHLTAAAAHEDTLRIAPGDGKSERLLRLVLPTLCITYADMDFQNAVGGEQQDYPASRSYGPRFFDPLITITDEADIQRLTYIRGAQRVTIGSETTAIDFGSWNTLVVPRLRLDSKTAAEARIEIPETPIPVEAPLVVDVMQLADGRHVGGVRIEKRHPDYAPPVDEALHELWVRVVDGVSLQPLPEVRVTVWRWKPDVSTPYGRGWFAVDDVVWTDGAGNADVGLRPAGELEAVVATVPGHLVVPRCARPLPGQPVRYHMRAWPLVPDSLRFTWRPGDSLERLAQLTGRTEADILARNRVADARSLRAGARLHLPCYAASYRFESWDDPDRVAKVFGYDDVGTLLKVNGLRDLGDYDPSVGLKLPDWRFLSARDGDTLDRLDDTFGLPRGSCIAVGRVFRPHPRMLMACETFAVPSLVRAEHVRRHRGATQQSMA